MSSEKFSLKWNDFQKTVSYSFSSFRKEEEFVDVTLVSDDQAFVKGHKLVLSACSDVFKSILKKSSPSNSFIYLPGISSLNLRFIMDYIYQGEVQIYQEQLDEFLEVAKTLKISGLTSDLYEDESNLHNQHQKQVFKSDVANDFKMESFNTEQLGTQENKSFPVSTEISNVEKFNFPGIDTTELDEKIQNMIEVRDGKFTCTVCGKTSDRRFNLGKHIETHIEGLSFPCQLCGKVFRYRNSLQKHKSTFHKKLFLFSDPIHNL